MKKILCLLLCLVLLLSASACGAAVTSDEPLAASASGLTAAVLYAGSAEDWHDTYDRLDQSLLADLTVTAVDAADESADLSAYDAVYPDVSLLQAENVSYWKDKIEAYVSGGGSVFLENAFCRLFSLDFIGAKELVKLSGAPENLTFPSVDGDAQAMQDIISDFSVLYPSYADYARLSGYDYGYGVKPKAGVAVLAQTDEAALYTLNSYGSGWVFFTNPLLPNRFSVNGCELVSRSEEQVSFANTTGSANQILENEFAAFVSETKYGYALYRVFGCYTRPAMAWQLHYEEQTGIENHSSELFTALCESFEQIPSFTLVRNSYTWFLRAESVTYLLAGEGRTYAMDPYENAYSSGDHIAADGAWLSLARIENSGSYFTDYPEYGQRAYPCPCDLNGDGNMDLIVGSSDGLFHLYMGRGFGANYETAADTLLTDSAGNALSVSGYSAPALLDMDGDGRKDLVSGCSDGQLYWFRNNGDGTYEPRGSFLSVCSGACMPSAGDLNGDGADDLAVGSYEGVLKCWTGDGRGGFAESEDLSGLSGELGQWLAPCVNDLDGDGDADLAVGVYDGYIAEVLSGPDGYAFSGYMTGDDTNYKGNENLKFGTNCVPAFWDMNGDGLADLLAGSLEYGLAYPVDSPYFPAADALSEQIQFMEKNDFYIGMHDLSGAYATAAHETAEMDMQKTAYARYGLDFTGGGVNQHTWYMSSYAPSQTYALQWLEGLLWNSGSRSSRGTWAPESGAENALSFPYYLVEDGERTLLCFNTGTLLSTYDGWEAFAASFDMPLSMYYHCDLMYRDDSDAQHAVQRADNFRTEYDYNFVREDQLAKSMAAAYNLTVTADVRTGDGLSLTLSGGAAAEDGALYDADYQAAAGVRVQFSEKYRGSSVSTDADVWYQGDNCIYVSLNGATSVTVGGTAGGTHIQRVNLPAKMTVTDTGAVLEFLDDGMMQVYVEGAASTPDEGWTVEQSDGLTVFTRYGARAALNIVFD